ncbi:CDK5RAP1-like protein [Selaginella moellendorffii]|uniref:CDK5RAP1-like protein n=1 Tax=Selaginella moellendorffii TaxID=88036 RepID=UPI000D1C23E5|nr:CDK5RAP1-like protein [Selaginella moellendorffii]|eukprot:XP_024544453.1 CDK5RAP1-like protein [Selaginella moellendorffii]
MEMAMVPGRSLCVAASTFASEHWNGGRARLRLVNRGVRAAASVAILPTAEELPSSPSSILEGRKLYLETYGCQMNFNDVEVVLAIMKKAGYGDIVQLPEESDVILINTCAIRDNAENKIWQRLNYFKHIKSNWRKNGTKSSRPPPKVAVLGCMAERLKEKLIEADKMVDVVCGPDAYRDLPRLLSSVEQGQQAINTLLSLEETYADVSPVRIAKDSVTAFVSIMRGCNNMCAFCIVPFTRGRERSRPLESIVREVGELWEQGVKEVTLLGQNVNSYCDLSNTPGITEGDLAEDQRREQEKKKSEAVVVGQGKHAIKYFQSDVLSSGFSAIYRTNESGLRFASLLKCLAETYPEMRFRFTSPHPKDFPDDLLLVMREHHNVCNSIHLPVQSGSSRVLERMRRGYTREAYLELVERIREIIPGVALSSDFIAGFCGETEEDHLQTLSIVETVGYEMAYMFAYSMREKTPAHRHDVDDVPEEVKQRRLSELIATFKRSSAARYHSQLGKTQLVLIEAPNKRNPNEWGGRCDSGQKVFFSRAPVPDHQSGDLVDTKPGDYVAVKILDTTFASLRGEPLRRTSLQAFYSEPR